MTEGKTWAKDQTLEGKTKIKLNKNKTRTILCKGFGFSRHFLKYFFVYVEELMNEIQNSFGMSFIVVY